MTNAHDRPAALAGTWYPGKAAALRSAVEDYLGDPAPPPANRCRVLMVPHAGFSYSGAAAGKGYRRLAGQVFGRIVILAPNHRAALDRPAAAGADAFMTPLGRVPLDREACRRLAATTAVVTDPDAHALEHAVEIQLPFLQIVFTKMPPIVPLLVPHLDPARFAAAVEALRDLIEEDTLVIVSTDMTHYGRPFAFTPFPEDPQGGIRKLDRGAIERILAWDAAGLLEYGRRTGITMCGLQAMALAMSLHKASDLRIEEVAYDRSGDRDNSYDFSVSYCTIAADAVNRTR